MNMMAVNLTDQVRGIAKVVTSVANGDEFFRKNPGATVPMPEGFKVFETTGAWESYYIG